MSTAPRLVVGPEALGTPESEWLPIPALPRFSLDGISNAVIVAPHPDDEVLALGGTMKLLADRGCRVSILAVTDGEASHPRVAPMRLAHVRAAEREAALRELRTPRTRVTRLHLPDGGVTRETGLADWLEPLLAGASHCFAPWELDGHPDHDACGRAAALACHRTGTLLVRYPVWAWHWTTPATFPWQTAERIELDPETLAAKHAAIAEYRSQIAPLAGETILPPPVLARFLRPFEVVLL